LIAPTIFLTAREARDNILALSSLLLSLLLVVLPSPSKITNPCVLVYFSLLPWFEKKSLLFYLKLVHKAFFGSLFRCRGCSWWLVRSVQFFQAHNLFWV